jgi:hypothetical protein
MSREPHRSPASAYSFIFSFISVLCYLAICFLLITPHDGQFPLSQPDPALHVLLQSLLSCIHVDRRLYPPSLSPWTFLYSTLPR